MEKEFKIGDLVTLKSGSPCLTVFEVRKATDKMDGLVITKFFSGDRVDCLSGPPEIFRLVPKPFPT